MRQLTTMIIIFGHDKKWWVFKVSLKVGLTQKSKILLQLVGNSRKINGPLESAKDCYPVVSDGLDMTPFQSLAFEEL